MKAEKWALLGVGVFVVVMICAGIEGYNEQKEEQEQVNEVEEEMELIGVYTAGFLKLYKLHDNKDNLTCWVYNRGGQGGGGISCIPDHLLTP